MRLHSPFIIGPRLLPALKIGEAILSLESIEPGARDTANFILDLPDGSEYRDGNLHSGAGGFHSTVDAFDTFLAFLNAAGEAIRYQEQTGRKSDNADLYPPNVMQWCADHVSDIESLHMDIQDESGSQRAELIQEDE
jgi:hypothetical protein